MPETSQEVYHCPSCGALAAVDPGESGERVCEECGFEFGKAVRLSPRHAGSQPANQGSFVQRNVRSRRRSANRVEPVLPSEPVLSAPPGEDLPTSDHGDDVVVSDDGRKKVVRRRKKRRRARLGPLLFLSAWAVGIMVVVILVRVYRGEEFIEPDPRDVARAQEAIQQEKMREFLSKHLQECHDTLLGFLTAETSDARTQFVRDPKRLAPTMRSYYSQEIPWELPDGATLEVRRSNVLMRDDGTTVLAIETIFGVKGSEESPQPDREVAFFLQEGRWVLDWEALVRYSTVSPWQLFLDEVADSEGEFRVYMRYGRERVFIGGNQAFKLQFYPPRNDEDVWERGTDSVYVPVDSENGRRLQWISDQAKEERRVGDSIFGVDDPPELHRVRVRLYWDGPTEDRKLELGKVLAANWYGKGREEDFGEKSTDGDQPGETASKEGEEQTNEELAPDDSLRSPPVAWSGSLPVAH